MPNSPKPEGRLVALFFLGVLLLSYPLLSIFDRGVLLGGLPLPFLYVFVVWGALIFLLARFVDRRG